MKIITNNDKINVAKFELGILEAKQGNIEEPKEHFESLSFQIDKSIAFEELILMEFKSKNYTRALELIRIALSCGVAIAKEIIIAVSKELNIFFENIDYSTIMPTYSFDQSIDYDEYGAIDYIISTYCNPNMSGSFNEGVDVYSLFNDAKELLTEENLVRDYDNCNDTYVIHYPNIGSEGQNFLRVVTLPNSKNILTMYPVFGLFDELANNNEKIKFDSKNDSQKLLLEK